MLVKTTNYPPAGWNSYDCYGVFINEKQALENLDYFIKRLKPFGYEYFVIDAGWYMDHKFSSDYNEEDYKPNIDKYGRFVASPVNFPNGLKYLADACHAGGVKFGVHIMRGIPRVACERNTPIMYSSCSANDIVDKDSICTWGPLGYGVDTTKPGAQEYYDSVVAYLAENRIDFIKADDIVEFPDEIEILAKAIDKVERPIILSLSPGNETFAGNWDTFKQYGNMVRITRDIWDLATHANLVLDLWERWENYGDSDCWLDLDMLPLGGIQVHVPENTTEEACPVLGHHRQSNLTHAQKKTFITQRAMAASPLFFGGDLPSTPNSDFELVTNAEILACNRNGVVGKKIFGQRHIDIRHVIEKKQMEHGWIGIFNRQPLARKITVTAAEMGFNKGFPAKMLDVWNNCRIKTEENTLCIYLDLNDVLFIRY